MRLTLRTMLAYLDDVLEPADADVLAKKIDESEFASGLVQRVKGALRKLRMEAPKLDGKGMGNDANTVAEYLDSSLPQDRVGEFERVCLESDKHLCEVAACHQILTLVLGKAADVPPNLRDRIYTLGDPGRAGVDMPRPPAAALAGATAGPPPVVKGNGQPTDEAPPLEVPDYLREGRKPSVWPFVAVGATALALTLLVVWQVAKLNRARHQVAMNEEHAAAITPGTGAAAIAATRPDAAEPPAPQTPDNVAATNSTALPATPTPATEDAAAASAVAASDRPAEDAPDKIAAATPMPPTPPAPVEADAPTPAAAKTPPTKTTVPKAPKAKADVAAAPPKPQPMDVGRYTSDGQLLATLDADDGLWYPKLAQEVLVAGERVTVLPPYRPQIALPSAVQLTFAGEGAARMEEPGENNIPRMTIDYGRFLVATAGKAGAQVELNLAGIKGVVTLTDADTVLAIKAIRWIPPGADPEAIEGVPVIEMYNANGRATWQEAEHAKIELPPRHVHVYYNGDPPETHGPFLPPEWTEARSVKPIDRDAAIVLERLVDRERPLNMSLQEVMKDRRVEVRALAARCLAALGDFEPILRELADANQYSFWTGEFEALHRALARDPETAAKVRETLNLIRAADAKELYRLLWSYNEDQLEKGAAAQLVKQLEHEQMDVRVLAFVNLASITGVQSYYQPHKPPSQMKTPIRDWNDRLKKGTIIYKGPASPLDRYRPAEPAAGAAAPATPPPPMPR